MNWQQDVLENLWCFRKTFYFFLLLFVVSPPSTCLLYSILRKDFLFRVFCSGAYNNDSKLRYSTSCSQYVSTLKIFSFFSPPLCIFQLVWLIVFNWLDDQVEDYSFLCTISGLVSLYVSNFLMSQWFVTINASLKSIFVPTATLVGREELYTQLVFFVQTILADRYIHRRELWVVSLKSSSSVEHGIKKIFSVFVFYSKFCEHSTVFVHNFSNFC